MKECPFCNIGKEKIISSNDLCFAIYDNSPVNKGHVLIIPFRHFDSYFDATKEEKHAIIDLMEDVKRLIDEKYSPDGYNLGVNIGFYSGQTVMHVHYHVIPRYKGDIKVPKGGVRGVIPDKKLY